MWIEKTKSEIGACVVVLGIETSCDETAAAVIDDGTDIRSNIVYSQLAHGRYGGVVPELASRAHIRKVLPVVQAALSEADLELDELDGVAVTRGPGLIGSLVIGLSVAKGICVSRGLPLIGIQHIEGHIFAIVLEHPEISPPFLCLVASGGHTELIYVPEWCVYELLGRTRDDAAGEAFDKVAKVLGVMRPEGPAMGGPILAHLAERGDRTYVAFPRGLSRPGNLEFSFSGLKTAVLRHLRGLDRSEIERRLPDIAASFQEAVVDVLVSKTMAAARLKRVDRVVLAGGVAANAALRGRLTCVAKAEGMAAFCPSPKLCTDNAAMIAAAGAFRLARGERSGLELDADPRLRLG